MERKFRAFWVEDDKRTRDEFRPDFESMGLDLIEGFWLADVYKLIESDDEIKVAILDAEFPNKGDGKEAAAVLREKFPGIKIISLSADLQDWGDLNLTKLMIPNEIKQAVRNFLQED